jgi:hypothetical protein
LHPLFIHVRKWKCFNFVQVNVDLLKTSHLIDISLYSNANISWFRAKKYLMLLFITACLLENSQIPISLYLVWPDLCMQFNDGLESDLIIYFVWSIVYCQWENHRPFSNHWESLSYICIEYTSRRTGFELTTLMVIVTDCTGSCKSNYHMITAAPGEGVCSLVNYLCVICVSRSN